MQSFPYSADGQVIISTLHITIWCLTLLKRQLICNSYAEVKRLFILIKSIFIISTDDAHGLSTIVFRSSLGHIREGTRQVWATYYTGCANGDYPWYMPLVFHAYKQISTLQFLVTTDNSRLNEPGLDERNSITETGSKNRIQNWYKTSACISLRTSRFINNRRQVRFTAPRA